MVLIVIFGLAGNEVHQTLFDWLVWPGFVLSGVIVYSIIWIVFKYLVTGNSKAGIIILNLFSAFYMAHNLYVLKDSILGFKNTALVFISIVVTFVGILYCSYQANESKMKT